MEITIAGSTHTGRVRQNNEDALVLGDLLTQAPRGRPAVLHLSQPEPVLLAVADGLGGHAAGERASRLALSQLAWGDDDLADPEALYRALVGADAAVRDESSASPAWHGMATTVAGFVFTAGRALCFNVGDSRCYAVRDGLLVQTSTDDSDDDVGRPGSQRSGVVTQTLGRPGRGGAPLDPHLTWHDAAPGQRFLACSDGLSGVVPLEVIETAVLADQPLQSVAEVLVALALAAGGPDNVTVGLAEVVG